MDKDLEIKIKELNSSTGPQALILAAMCADELEMSGVLHMERDQYIGEKAIEIANKFEEAELKEKKKMEDGFSLLRKRLEALPDNIKDVFEENLDQITKRTKDLIYANFENINSLASQWASCETMREVLGFSDELMEWIYQVGLGLFNEKKFTEAESIFLILLKLNHLMPNYWIALALSKKELNEYQESLFLFNSLTFLDPANPIARYHSADLYLKLDQIEEALTELQELAIIIDQTKEESWRSLYDALAKIASQKSQVGGMS
ncbi:MAG: hypothetical protein V4489_00965 [Chlamydiota bacterium]